MAKISHAELLSLLHYDPATGAFTWKARPPNRLRGTGAGSVGVDGYRRICIRQKRYPAHVLAWFYIHGVWPARQIDHRDLSRDNNAITNLREATGSQNLANAPQPKDSRAPLKGAHWNRARGYWQAAIGVRGKTIWLGRYHTPEDAHAAYMRAAIEHYGEFARAA